MAESSNIDEMALPWDQLRGMTEEQAEELMRKKWGLKVLPDRWFDPLERDALTKRPGQAELSAHLNAGTQAYGNPNKLGSQAAGVWHQRNIAGQGHPAEPAWTKTQQEVKKKG